VDTSDNRSEVWKIRYGGTTWSQLKSANLASRSNENTFYGVSERLQRKNGNRTSLISRAVRILNKKITGGNLHLACIDNTTTTNRHGSKIISTSRVFPLTPFSHAPILRFQIRGNVEAPGGPGRGFTTSPRSATSTSPGSKQKIERDPTRARMRSVKRCCEGCVNPPANCSALR